MNCKEFENRIPDFLEDKLNNRQARDFFEHLDSCEECKEELRIQYLIAEGTIRLEEGESFDLNRELDLKVEKAKKTIKNRRITNMIIYVMEAIALAAVVFILILVFVAKVSL